MAEWFKAAVLKTVSRKWDVGSNPTPSARFLPKQVGVCKMFNRSVAWEFIKG